MRKSQYWKMADLGSSPILLQYRSVKIGVQEKRYNSALLLGNVYMLPERFESVDMLPDCQESVDRLHDFWKSVDMLLKFSECVDMLPDFRKV